MFGRLTRLLNNFSSLDSNIIFLKIVSEDNVQKFIIDLNRFDQLFDAGVNSDGNPLPTYSPYSELVSSDETFTLTSFNGETLSKKKKSGDSWFLLAKGELYNSFSVRVDDGSFTIENSGTIKLNKKESVDYKFYDILGLTDESKSEFTQKILPMVIREVRTILLS